MTEEKKDASPERSLHQKPTHYNDGWQGGHKKRGNLFNQWRLIEEGKTADCWLLTWYIPNNAEGFKTRSWPPQEQPPVEALEMQTQLKLQGCQTWLTAWKANPAAARWRVFWNEDIGTKKSRLFPYTDAGLQEAIAFRDAVYQRIGNTNGIRKEYGDGVSPH